jgi:hypothetical protein
MSKLMLVCINAAHKDGVRGSDPSATSGATWKHGTVADHEYCDKIPKVCVNTLFGADIN